MFIYIYIAKMYSFQKASVSEDNFIQMNYILTEVNGNTYCLPKIV